MVVEGPVKISASHAPLQSWLIGFDGVMYDGVDFIELGLKPVPIEAFVQHPQLPIKTPQLPSNSDNKTMNGGALRGLG